MKIQEEIEEIAAQEEMEQINKKILAMLDKKERVKPTRERFKVTLRMDNICLVVLPTSYCFSNKYYANREDYGTPPPKNKDIVKVIREYADGFTSVSREGKEWGYYIETKYLKFIRK